VRDNISTETVDAAYMIDKRNGYIRITSFGAKTHGEFVTKLDSLKRQGMKNLVLDLSGNGGGYLNSAVEILGELIGEESLVVYTEGKNSPRSDYHAYGSGKFRKGNLVVIVDETSASASEILAGAVQDWDRGLIVGRRTFGKGLVQRPFQLPDGSMIRLTIARYYTPTGRCIQKPYGGDSVKYEDDLLNRYNSGEMTSADSIHFPDSLKTYTLRLQRPVYGGGGIMPDYFVPLDTTKNTSLYRQIVAKRILIDANLRHLAKHRNELKEKYPTFEDFRHKYEVPEEIIENIYAEAKKALKDKYPKDEEEKTTGLLKLMLRALAARDLWDMNEYFAIIYEDDDIVKKAVQLMEE
jgi:carboxyl-terminal processing protease